MAFPPFDSPETFPESFADHEQGAGYPGRRRPFNLEAGRQVDRYEVRHWLGQGASATVYRVVHHALHTDYALKVLHGLAPGQRERLVQEGRLQSNLNHPHIVRVHDVLDVQGAPALLMDYVPGESLAELLAREALDFEEIEIVFRQILDAVEYAHRQGVVHRDLKPANVLITRGDARSFARVTDFGIAKYLEAGSLAATRTGALLGTLEYMAPEQLRGEVSVDARADLFALGVILYELCVGARPYAHKHLVQLVTAIERAQYIPLEEVCPEIPGHLKKAIEATLIADPARRVADGATLMAILNGESWERPEAPPEREDEEDSQGEEGVEKGGSWSAPGSAKPGSAKPGSAKRPLFVLLGLLMTCVLAAGMHHVRLAMSQAESEREQVRARMEAETEAARLAMEAWKRVQEQPGEALALFRAADKLFEDASAEQGGRERLLSPDLFADLISRGAAVSQFPFGDQVSQAAFSPSGKLLAGGSLSGEIVVWNLASGEELIRFDAGVRERLMGLYFTPDSGRLVVLPGASDSAPGRSDPARIFDVQTGTLIHTLSHGERTAFLEISADARHGATLGYDHRVILWDLQTGSPLRTLGSDDEKSVTGCLAFSPTQAAVAGGNVSRPEDSWFSIFRPSGKGEIQEQDWVETRLMAPQEYIGLGECRVRFSGDGHFLVAAVGHGILVWDVNSGALINEVSTSAWRVLEVDPLGRTLVHGTSSGELILRSLEDLSEIATLRASEGTISKAVFWRRDKEDSWLATGGTDGLVRIYSGTGGTLLAELAGNRSWLLGLDVLGESGKTVVAGAGRDNMLRTWAFSPSPPGIRDLNEEMRSQAGEGQGEGRTRVVSHRWSDDGRKLLLTSRGWSLWGWDLEQEGPLFSRRFSGPIQAAHVGAQRGAPTELVHGALLRSGEVFAITEDLEEGEVSPRATVLDGDRVWFSPSGERFVVARSHAFVIETPEEEEPFREVLFRDKLRQVDVDWERRRAVIVDNRNHLTLVDMGEGTEPVSMALGHEEGAALTLSSDGEKALVGFWSGDAELWDLERRERVAELKGHGDSVTVVGFSPDGQRAVTGSGDHHLRIWKSKSGALESTLRAHRRPVIGARFSDSGRFLASIGMDRKLCLFEVERALLLGCWKVGGVPLDLRLRESREKETLGVDVLDQEYRLWHWEVDELGERARELSSFSGALTNLRVCPQSERVIAVLPFPDPETVWAPKTSCEASIQE